MSRENEDVHHAMPADLQRGAQGQIRWNQSDAAPNSKRDVVIAEASEAVVIRVGVICPFRHGQDVSESHIEGTLQEHAKAMLVFRLCISRDTLLDLLHADRRYVQMHWSQTPLNLRIDFSLSASGMVAGSVGSKR